MACEIKSKCGVSPFITTPKAINPRFQQGDRVQIVLKKHLTDQWLGVIENSFFRPGLRSNVYGVRFAERGNLYTRYYESNLKKAPSITGTTS